ncbi:MAG TPA: response regulator [Mycobacteriales bacterium]|nr:response regulator [Mycobacteriales bacterium]
MPRALIVDDEEDIRFLIRLTIELANEGLAVSAEAASGEAAIESWHAERPEVIVLDNRMPGMSGLEVAERILSEDPQQSIILYSAYLDEETVAEATRIGIRQCLAKGDYSRLPEELWRHAARA